MTGDAPTPPPPTRLTPGDIPQGAPAAASPVRHAGSGAAEAAKGADVCRTITTVSKDEAPRALKECVAAFPQTSESSALGYKSMYVTSAGFTEYVSSAGDIHGPLGFWQSDGPADIFAGDRSLYRLTADGPWKREVPEADFGGRTPEEFDRFVYASTIFSIAVKDCTQLTYERHTNGWRTIHCSDPGHTARSIDLTFDAQWLPTLWRAVDEHGANVEWRFWDVGVANTIEVPNV